MKYYPKFSIVYKTAKSTSALVWEVDLISWLLHRAAREMHLQSLQGLHKAHRESSVPD